MSGLFKPLSPRIAINGRVQPTDPPYLMPSAGPYFQWIDQTVNPLWNCIVSAAAGQVFIIFLELGKNLVARNDHKLVRRMAPKHANYISLSLFLYE